MIVLGMDIQKLLGIKSKHPKLIKALDQIEAYEAEEKDLDRLVKEAWECKKCDSLADHISYCVEK